LVEVLEGRQLLTASLAAISNITVPALLGYQQPLAVGTVTPVPTSQTFTATSSNPDIKVTVAQGQFWTVTVSNTAANINRESMTFQLFGDLTPQTVARITTLTNEGYYTNGFPTQTPPVLPGQYIPRITSTTSTPAASFSIIQGGSSSATSTSSSSGLTPIATEPVQQLAFTGQNQLAMANTGAPNSTDAQFFITNGTLSQSVQQAFDFNYTIFGQLVSGQQTVTDLVNKVTVTTNSSGEDSQPTTPVVINSVGLSSTNPNGVLLIDTTGATAGERATITVKATDTNDPTGKPATQTFTVTVGAYNGPTNSVTSSVTANKPQLIQLQRSAPPSTLANFNISYQLFSQPAHGTISQFNPTAGTLVYTPNSNYSGPDTFQYQVLAQANSSAPKTVISMGTVQLNVTTRAVHLIDNDVLVVTPLPRTDHGTDNIEISQQADSTVSGGQKIVVLVNGVPDEIQPPANSLFQIIVFGGKASTDIQVDPNVSKTIPITLDGGHGGENVIQAGAGPTRQHGWFGHTLLIGGTGSDALIGRKGFVRFKPTTTTNLIYAGVIKPRFSHRTVAPSGTYYRFEKGRLVPVLIT